MKKTAPGHRLDSALEPETHGRTVVLFMLVSSVLHMAFIAAVITAPGLAPARRFTPAVIDVSLVSMPAGGGQPPPAAAKPAEIPQKLPAPKAPERITPAKAPEPEVSSPVVSVSPETKPKSKESLKRKTFQSAEVVKSAVDRLEEKIEDARHPSVEEAISRLKREVEREAPPSGGGGETEKAPTTAGAAGTGRGTTPADISDRERIYQAEIAYRVQRNWAFSEQVAGGHTDLEAALAIKIMPDGEIREIWFDQRSGNRHLDESAYRAIVKSNPLPPLPQGIFDSHYIVGLRFGPKGIK